LTELHYVLDQVDPLEVFGVNNSRFRQLKDQFPELAFLARGSDLKITGPEIYLQKVKLFLDELLDELDHHEQVSQQRFTEILTGATPSINRGLGDGVIVHGVRGRVVKARTAGQAEMVNLAAKNDILFAIGPAGTGKTYVAVALAVRALKEKQVSKIFLARPAVEAGENLGFLPGDLREKVDPYLRPLYDSLEDMYHFDKLQGLLDKNTIEIAPLAYMRGRTLSNAFIILDEAQNATEMQMKMFLTRLGVGSKIIITGDDTQIDLPRSQRSGFTQALNLLSGVEGIATVRLTVLDVVRHSLVRKIIEAYGTLDKKNE
jgi:phosphate starvation-inducible protein PhoH and related proteins